MMVKKVLLLLGLILGLHFAEVYAKKGFTVVLDAGHGGRDTGALGAISKEKDINLNVTMAFGRLIERNLPNVNVIYTRKTDLFLSLKERANIANRAKADLFISIHTNSVPPGRSPMGFQVYTLGMHRAKDNLDVAMRENSVISLESDYKQTYEGFNPQSSESYIMFEFLQSANMEKSVKLARLIQKSVCNTANRIDKGVHQAGFLVLRETSMPSCLVELGFITSSEEEAFLNTEKGIELMARGLYEAFVDYKNMYDDHVVIPYRSNNNKKVTVDRLLPQTNKSLTKVEDKPKVRENKQIKTNEKSVRTDNTKQK